MDGMQDVLARFDALELLIVRATGLIGVLLICLLVTWNHIKNLFKGKRKEGEENRTIRRSKKEK